MTRNTYRSENGRHFFSFSFARRDGYFDIFCHRRPGLNGKSADPHKTHVFANNKICFYEGREPKSEAEARQRAKEWAEYYLEYRRTGNAQ